MSNGRDDEWESPPPSPKPEAPRPKLASLPQELRKGARNIQFVLEDHPPPAPVSPKERSKPPPIPEKPALTRRESWVEGDGPHPTLNTKPVPPPKPVSKRLSIDSTSIQEVSKALAEEENARVESDADKKNNRKSMGGTFSGRNLKERIDAMANAPPPLTLASPGKEPRPEPTVGATPETRKKGSSLSSSIKSLLPKSRTAEKPPLTAAFDPPTSEDRGSPPVGRNALAQSLSLPATSPRPGGSAVSGGGSLRTSVQNMFSRKTERDDDNAYPDGTHSAPTSQPASPRGAPHSSTEDTAVVETFHTWDTQPTPEHLLAWRSSPAPPPPDALPPLISLSEGSLWRVEHGGVFVDEKESALYTATTFNYTEEEYHYYAEGIFPREHTTWITAGPEDSSLGPLVLSLETLTPSSRTARILIRARTGDTRLTFPIQKGQPRDVMRAFTEENPLYDKVKWKEVGDDDMEKELLDMERKAVKLLKSYKIGLLLCLDGQKDESEMLRNRDHTPAYDEFLEMIGDKVELLGFEGYHGGLDTSKNKTGTHTVFTSFEGHSVMWHVSTLLPYFPDDAQQLERKRHLGNDVVTLVFKEGNTPFNPACLTSQFTHAVCVVQKVENSNPTQYRVGFSYRNGCRPHTPLLTHPCIYTKGPDFKRFLLTKLVNAERASFHAPSFAEKFTKVRLLMLRELVIKAGSTVPRRSVIGKAGSVIAAPIVSALPLVSPKRNTAGSRIERPLATERPMRPEAVPYDGMTSARTADDSPLTASTSTSGSRISRAGGTEKDREKERKEREKLEKEREKAEKKERERLDKEREKLEKEKKKDDKEKAKSGAKEPTPRTDEPRAHNCLWIDKTSEFTPLVTAWNQTYPAILFKTFVSLDELTFWVNAREAKLKGVDFRVVCCRGKDIDLAEIEAVVSWVRFSSPISRSKILLYGGPNGLELLASPKRTYVSSDAAFCQQFATFKFNDA